MIDTCTILLSLDFKHRCKDRGYLPTNSQSRTLAQNKPMSVSVKCFKTSIELNLHIHTEQTIRRISGRIIALFHNSQDLGPNAAQGSVRRIRSSSITCLVIKHLNIDTPTLGNASKEQHTCLGLCSLFI